MAVGQRGHVLLSDDAGEKWQQAEVPVSADLVAVHFPDAEAGWAVGHDGVVLNSTDGGRTWVRQLDGRTLGNVLVPYYEGRGGDEKWIGEAKRFAAAGAENPFLDVWFQDARTGYVVGAFGLVLRTADGGKTWEPLATPPTTPRPCTCMRCAASARICSSPATGSPAETGPHQRNRFVAQQIPYQGTLFGLVGNERAVLAHGMRGNVVRSTDGGRSWGPACQLPCRRA